MTVGPAPGAPAAPAAPDGALPRPPGPTGSGARGDRRGPVIAVIALLVVGTVGAVLLTRTGPGTAGSPSPSVPPSVPPSHGLVDGQVYGPAIGMDALNNTQIGGPDLVTSSYRFRAATSSTLDSIRLYITDGKGYAGGNGGSMSISIQPDDGTDRHAPAGTSIAATAITPGNPITLGPLPRIVFPHPAALTAGTLYHIVFANTDPDPAVNFISLDGIYMFQPTVPRQPKYTDVDWGQPTRQGSGPWYDQDRTVPILELDYADGTIQGEGHIQVWVGSPKVISGPARARESFTVGGTDDRRFSTMAIRLTRVSGQGPLSLDLRTSDGTTVASGTILADDIPIGIPGSHKGPGQASWASVTLPSPATLVAGASYDLVVSSPADTVYSIYVLRKGVEYGFSPLTYFGEGRAMYDPGSGWVFFDQTGGTPNLDEGDLQFYLK